MSLGFFLFDFFSDRRSMRYLRCPALKIAAMLFLLVQQTDAQAVSPTPGWFALVIGNSQYTKVHPLSNHPINDAKAMSDQLTSLGFSVTYFPQVKLTDFRTQLFNLLMKASKAKVIVFYYAGHGAQDKSGKNYLLPIDFDPKAPNNAIDVNATMANFSNRISYTTNVVFILDACRDDPGFDLSDNGAQGLAQMSATPGLLLSCSAWPGKTSLDYDPDNPTGPNSLYTSVWIKNIVIPGKSIDEIGEDTRGEVYQVSNKQQFPVDQNGAFHSLILRPLVAPQFVQLANVLSQRYMVSSSAQAPGVIHVNVKPPTDFAQTSARESAISSVPLSTLVENASASYSVKKSPTTPNTYFVSLKRPSAEGALTNAVPVSGTVAFGNYGESSLNPSDPSIVKTAKILVYQSSKMSKVELQRINAELEDDDFTVFPSQKVTTDELPAKTEVDYFYNPYDQVEAGKVRDVIHDLYPKISPDIHYIADADQAAPRYFEIKFGKDSDFSH